MLNGKFFAGLPPKMIDRRENSSRGQNRQESHFFWPDDTQVDSVQETRVKRRNSLQLEPTERPRPQHRVSMAGDNDVDTRQMFNKEFAKSSIQFCDNILEETGATLNQRRPLRPTKSMRQEITTKPTATKMQLPSESVIDAAYTNAKKKQAYTSTIEFYDYADEEPSQRNNMRRPKMDMNDKRDVERNSKNSPKLQVKGNTRNLHMAEKKNNDVRDQQKYMPERGFETELDTALSPQRIIRNSVFEERNNSEEAKPQQMRNFIEENIRNINYEPEVEIPEYRIGRAGLIEEHRNNAERIPKKILKNITQDEMSRYSDYKKYRDEDLGDVQHLEHGMRNVRVRTSPKKHVTYRDETYMVEEQPVRRHYYENPDPEGDYDDNVMMTTNAGRSAPAHNSRAKSPNTKAGSSNNNNNLRQQFRPYTPDFNHTKNIDPHQYLEVSTAKKSLNNSYSNKKRLNNELRKISPKITAAPAASTITATLEQSASSDALKHLRSSIGFNNGEIVADNGFGGGDTATTPTASSSQRRNARNMAANKRVSVGLPD